jgi:tetratricopeptide (TPR) repeat protein
LRLTESSPVIDGRSATIEDILKNSPDSAFKAQLLVNLALKLAQDGDRQTALNYLEQATAIGQSLDKTTEKVSTLLLIAKAYHQLEVPDQSQALLQETEQIITQIKPPQQQELRLTLALAYEQLGATNLAQQTLRAIKPAPAPTPKPDFPFQTDEPWNVQLGISGQVNSHRDTTAFLGVDLDLYKQWDIRDFSSDATLYLDFDSSRSVNNFRPGSLSSMVYRRHYNEDWSFFTNLFVSTNQNFYASSNNDEDLEIIAVSYHGAGLNLWRGDKPRQFLDFQMGIGPRYEYSYINFQQLRNQIDPVFGFILYGRGFEIGGLSIDSTFYFTPVITDFNRYIIGSDSSFNLSLSKRWKLTNRLFMRYQNEPISQGTPNFEFFFSTGLQYEL